MICNLNNTLYADFYGSLPPVSIRGVASVLDGKVMAVGAISFVSGKNYVIFDAKPGFNKRDIIKGWSQLKLWLDPEKIYYALIDRDLETAPSMLNHFDFTHIVDNIYMYKGV